MRRWTITPAAVVPAALLIVLAAGCEARKSSNPLSPSVAGPIPGVEITAPRLLEPGQNFKFKENQQPIKLLIENASSTGVRPLKYAFEVASDSGFQTKVFARSGVPPGEGGRTSVQIDKLDLGRGYYWRARAEDGANIGIYAAAQFEVLPKPFLTGPSPISPANNDRVTERKPTLRARNSDRNAAVGALIYTFQIGRDQAFTQIVSAGTASEGAGETAWTSVGDLEYNFTHFWRARSSDGETTSDWGTTQVFRSSLAPAPVPSPGGGGNPGSCTGNHGPTIVKCVASKYPDKLAAGVSSGQRVANMQFLRDRIIEAGRCGGMDLAWNLKRGGPEISVDFLVERVGGTVIGHDIAFDYDNTGHSLELYWGDGTSPFYGGYSNGFSCQ
jgi:hypothetical protein